MDHQFTRQMQEWLNSKHESDAEIIKGADMLFRLNRNRFYHVRATRQPQAYRTNIEYELNKFLKIRLDNMTIEEVRKMNDIVISEAQAIIAEGEAENNGENQGKSEKNGDSIEENASTDDTELPSSDSDGVAVVRKGKRKDHDFLPKEVADLWDKRQAIQGNQIYLRDAQGDGRQGTMRPIRASKDSFGSRQEVSCRYAHLRLIPGDTCRP